MTSPQLSLDLPSKRSVFSVSDLASGLRELVEMEYGDVWVEGEISNFKRHRSGHCYFTLKDADAQLRCVMWRHFTRYVFFEPEDGMLVRVHGGMSVYEARGDMQLVAKSMQPAGEGALQRAFEAIKRKLSEEGLFDEERKKPLPPFPETIGVVTSGSGAALHDILTVLQRRYPAVRVLVCPVQVQGIGAAEEIADAIACFNRQYDDPVFRADVLIVGRGGGSLEDLWAFNEEVVARAIAASNIPIVSAVGHETDFSIADFVADLRAATPSIAAELCVPDRRELAAALHGARSRMEHCLRNRIERSRREVQAVLNSRALHRPEVRLRQYVQRVDDMHSRLDRATGALIERRLSKLEGCKHQLALLDPARPMDRGYVRVERDGKIVRRAAELETGDNIRLRFADDTRPATIVNEA